MPTVPGLGGKTVGRRWGTALVPSGDLIGPYPSWECRPTVPIQRKQDICVLVLPHNEQMQAANRLFLKPPSSFVSQPAVGSLAVFSD